MGIDDVKEKSASAEIDRPTAWLEAWPKQVVVGQLGQSLDGRIATPTGHSHYINGLPSRRFLHQLRAHVDAVVIGVGTALTDQPQLTVRHVEGQNPARVILDPSARINVDNPVLSDDGTPVWVVIAEATPRPAWPSHIQTLSLPLTDRGYAPKALLAALRAEGLMRVLIEGGPSTLSAFIDTQCMDRLYCMIAPMIIGSGPAGIQLPPIDHLDEAIRAPMRSIDLGGEWLVEVELKLNQPIS